MLRIFYLDDRSQPSSQKMFLIKSEVMHELKCKKPKNTIYGYFQVLFSRRWYLVLMGYITSISVGGGSHTFQVSNHVRKMLRNNFNLSIKIPADNISKQMIEYNSYILECPGVNVACIRAAKTVCSGSWGTSSLRGHSFMLNSARTHHCIHSPVSHCTSSTKGHTCNNREMI